MLSPPVAIRPSALAAIRAQIRDGASKSKYLQSNRFDTAILRRSPVSATLPYPWESRREPPEGDPAGAHFGLVLRFGGGTFPKFRPSKMSPLGLLAAASALAGSGFGGSLICGAAVTSLSQRKLNCSSMAIRR